MAKLPNNDLNAVVKDANVKPEDLDLMHLLDRGWAFLFYLRNWKLENRAVYAIFSNIATYCLSVERSLHATMSCKHMIGLQGILMSSLKRDLQAHVIGWWSRISWFMASYAQNVIRNFEPIYDLKKQRRLDLLETSANGGEVSKFWLEKYCFMARCPRYWRARFLLK